MYHRMYAPIRIIFTPLDGISLCMEYLKEVSTSHFEKGTPDLLHRRQPFWPAVYSMNGYYRVRILLALLNCIRSLFFLSLTDDIARHSCILSRFRRWFMFATMLPPWLRTKHAILSLECNCNKLGICHWRICSVPTLPNSPSTSFCQSNGCGDGFTNGSLVHK